MICSGGYILKLLALTTYVNAPGNLIPRYMGLHNIKKEMNCSPKAQENLTTDSQGLLTKGPLGIALQPLYFASSTFKSSLPCQSMSSGRGHHISGSGSILMPARMVSVQVKYTVEEKMGRCTLGLPPSVPSNNVV